jgi:hypothetical protein
LGADGLSDEESGSPMPEFFKVPGLEKVTDNNRNGQWWEGTRGGRHVSVWRGSKWFRLADEVRVSGPAIAVDVGGGRRFHACSAHAKAEVSGIAPRLWPSSRGRVLPGD